MRETILLYVGMIQIYSLRRKYQDSLAQKNPEITTASQKSKKGNFPTLQASQSEIF
jgi:hypothetical protein